MHPFSRYISKYDSLCVVIFVFCPSLGLILQIMINFGWSCKGLTQLSSGRRHWGIKKVRWSYDNRAGAKVVSRESPEKVIQLVRRLVLVGLGANVTFLPKIVPGLDNGITNALSRFQESRFWCLAPHASLTSDPFPEELCGLGCKKNLGIIPFSFPLHLSGLQLRMGNILVLCY